MHRRLNEEFVQTLLAITTEKEMAAFLHGILTPQEREELPKRLAIFKLLHKGIPQHEIAKKLHVGVATVTRGSMELKREKIQKTNWWQNLSYQLGG